jgi:hypothetical protein
MEMQQKKMKWDNPALWFMALAFLVFFFAKALLIPITHDESGTCLFYSTLSVEKIISFDYGTPWPSNHVLNTLAIKLSKYFFRMDQFTVRLPNLLCSVLFLFFAVRISRLFSKKMLVSTCIFLLFLANPYMNDFFSLARGYGMALSFMIGSLYYLLRSIKSLSIKNLSLVFLFAFLSIAANFTFLIFIAALNVLLLIICVLELKKGKIEKQIFLKLMTLFFFANLLIAAFSYLPVTRMSTTDQFQFWGQEGFVQETFLPMYHHFMYGKIYFPEQHVVLSVFILLVFGLTLICGLVLFFRKDEGKSISGKYFSCSSLLLTITLFINFLQHVFLGTPYLNGRTALVYLPLVATMLGSGLVIFSDYWKKTGRCVSLALLIFIFVHLFRTANLSFFREWWYDQNTLTVLSELEKIGKQEGKEKIVLNTHWLFHPSFDFYMHSKKITWLHLMGYHKEPQYDRNNEFYYTIALEYNLVPAGYKKIMEFDKGKDARAVFQYSPTIN